MLAWLQCVWGLKMKKIDIEQQRKPFEEWVLRHPDNLDLTAYEESIMFDAWLAAQQQEGYVMVPVGYLETLCAYGEQYHKEYDIEDLGEAVVAVQAMIQAAQE